MVPSRGRFVWYELMTTDPAGAAAFYGAVIGWSARDTQVPGSGYRLFVAADEPVAGAIKLPDGARGSGATSHWAGYVGVDDVDKAADDVLRFGGAVHIPPTDVANVSRFSVIADPQKATLALVKGRNPAQKRAPDAIDRPGHVGWHELLAADWETAFVFYNALFGWQKADSHDGAMGIYQRFSIDGAAVGGMFSKPASLPVPFWLYYFNVRDIEAAMLRVEAAGGQILYGPVAVPGGARIAHCTDPQGAIFGLVDRRKPIGYVTPERT